MGIGAATEEVFGDEDVLVSFFYRLLSDGDISPRRLDELISELEEMPAAVRVRVTRPDLARHARSEASRIAAIAGAEIRIGR